MPSNSIGPGRSLRLRALRPVLLSAAALIGACSQSVTPSKPQPAAAAYAPVASCIGCHAEIATAYRKTGMARSFTAFDPSRTTADFSRRNSFRHPASGQHFTMTMRGGAAYMRRHELDASGRETNVVERRIDYILGSGNKAQTMIHRTPRGELVEMPVAWYTGSGGYWAMNPGYDRPDHSGFRRRIRYDCFFCHNAYPAGVADDSWLADAVYPEKLPAGIDCQRCHGPGSAHVEAQGRAPIVNPRRLSRGAQLEICYQCHLQSTSSPLPHVVTRLGRGVFSFRAGEPLREYALHFDHPRGAGRDDKFEIAHAAYRLRQSKCFQASSVMTCTTCHDPHRAEPAGSERCKTCHTGATAHFKQAECVSCHMPQRRTDDVVQVNMTDHRIARQGKPELAQRAENHLPPYRGPVAPYLPADPGPLHRAVAQVRVGANLEAGVAALEKAVAAEPACASDCWYELADAFGRLKRFDKAAAAAEEALRRAPENQWILRAYGSLLSSQGNLARGAELLERARAKLPDDPGTLQALALNLGKQGRAAEAEALLRTAQQADPDSPEVHFTLGELLFAKQDATGARAAFAEAVRAKPDHALAHFNLAILDMQSPAAAEHFLLAVKHAPADARLRHTFGVWLASRRRTADAAVQLDAAVKVDAIRPDSHLALGMVLAELGQRARAIEHLRIAAAGTDAAVRDQAAQVLAQIR